MTARPTTEIDRARAGYWNSDPVSGGNPGGMDESADGTIAGHVDNFPAAVQAVGMMTQWVGEQVEAAGTLTAAVTAARDDVQTRQADVAAKHGVVVADAAQVATDRAAVAADKTAVHADRVAADADAVATAADRAAVATDKAATHADRLAADADAIATAADRAAVAADKTTVAADKTATHTDRLAADASAAAAAASAAGVSLPAITAGDAGKGLEVKADGSGWQLASLLKVAGGTLTGWLQTYAGVDAATLGLRIGEAGSGFYRSALGVVGFVAAGVEVFRTAATGVLTFYKAARPNVVTVPWASTITLNVDAGNVYHVTLAGPTTFANPTISSAMVGQWFTLVPKQDGTGSRTGAYGSYWKPKGGVHVVLTTTAGKADHLYCYVYSTTEIHYASNLNF